MRYSNEPNPIRRAESQPPDPFDYEPRVAAVFGEMGNFANWTGTVRFSVENSQVYLAFYPDCAGAPQAIQFSTAHFRSGQFADASTSIPLNSPIARVLRDGGENLRVWVTGHVFSQNGFVNVQHTGGSPNPVSVIKVRRRMHRPPWRYQHYLAHFESVEPTAGRL